MMGGNVNTQTEVGAAANTAVDKGTIDDEELRAVTGSCSGEPGSGTCGMQAYNDYHEAMSYHPVNWVRGQICG